MCNLRDNAMSCSKYVCPECSSSIVAWADLDAQITFKVSKNGNLTNKKIENTFQSDSRCGVYCSECDWKLDELSAEDEPFFELACEALEQQTQIKLLSAKLSK